MKDVGIYLVDIRNAIVSILSFVDGMSYNDFEEDDKSISAVVRKFQIMGEVVKKVPADFREAHPSVPWSSIARMRDILIHQYNEVDNKILWDAITDDLPGLLSHVNVILEEVK